MIDSWGSVWARMPVPIRCLWKRDGSGMAAGRRVARHRPFADERLQGTPVPREARPGRRPPTDSAIAVHSDGGKLTTWSSIGLSSLNFTKSKKSRTFC